MSGRVLIIDEVATSRILLRVRLAAASYDVLRCATLEDAGTILAQEAVALVLLALPDDEAPLPMDVIACLGCGSRGGLPPLVVLMDRVASETRVAWIAAGAEDVVPRSEAPYLMARIRSVLRRQSHAEEAIDAYGQARSRPDQLFVPPPARMPLLLVAPTPPEPAEGRSLARGLGAKVAYVSPETIARGGVRGSHHLLLRDGDPDGALMLDLLASIRARPETSRAVVMYQGAAGADLALARALDLGACDAFPAGVAWEEVRLRRARAAERRVEESRRRAALAANLRAALHDPLTGLANRRMAMPRLSEMVREADRSGLPMALLVIDLDRFKRINDALGHPVGDAVLVEAARRLQGAIRPGDLIARHGGEEFLVGMSNLDAPGALAAAQRLCRVLADTPVSIGSPGARPHQGRTAADRSGDGRPRQIELTASIGVAIHAPRGKGDLAALISRADRALYRGKAEGRNRAVLDEDRPARSGPEDLQSDARLLSRRAANAASSRCA